MKEVGEGEEENSQFIVDSTVDQAQQSEQVEVPSIMYFLKQPNIFKNLAALTVIWIVAGFNYFMVNFQVKYFPGDFAVNTAAMYGSDIASALLVLPCIVYLAPKTAFQLFSTIMFIAGLIMVFFIDGVDPGIEFPLIVSVARIGSCCLFIGVWTLHPQFFPTLFCATSLGYANIFCRLFVITAPLIAEWAYPMPMLIFTVMAFLAFCASMFIVQEPTKAAELK